jgi:hypothetical protein
MVPAVVRVRTIATAGAYGWTPLALRRGAARGRRRAPRRRAPNPRRSRPRVLVGERTASAEGARSDRHRLLAPQGARADDRAPARAVPRGRADRRRQALARRTRARVPRAVPTRILDQLDLGPRIDELPTDRALALFCVERDPGACHRSLVAERLAEEYHFAVVHLLPNSSWMAVSE